jgi:hypothetical protein
MGFKKYKEGKSDCLKSPDKKIPGFIKPGKYYKR